MNTSPSDARALFIQSVKRAFADALVTEIHRSRLGRREVAEAGGISRTYLQLLLRPARHASIGTLISLAEGMGVAPERLFMKTMENLNRIRAALASPACVTSSCVHDRRTEDATSEDPQGALR
jgi:transcriptional regulator with XRE-family HTH domain